jgi:hypothetical protein
MGKLAGASCSAVIVFASLALGCAAHGSLDGAGAPDGGDLGTGDDAAATGPTQLDSGPPATVGDDQPDTGTTTTTHDGGGGDAGTDGPSGPTSCSSVGDCPFGSAHGVAGVACTNHTCVITCATESYDVNGDPHDGCEVDDVCASSQGNQVCASGADPQDDHTQPLAANAGSYPCTDSSSAQNMQGVVPSDARGPHQPPTDGFDPTTGAAPDYFSILGTGGALCQDDANLELQMNAPAKQQGCYELHLLTDKNGGQMCTTDLTGHCSITNGSGSYSDNSTLWVWVQKTASCTAAQFPDDAPYTITGHL